MTDFDRVIATLDEISALLGKATENLRACLAATSAGSPEPTATADTFCAGDWIRPTPSPVWRQINNCAYCWCRHYAVEHVVVALTGNADTLHLRKTDALPYLTDAQFDRACRAEQDEAADRLQRAEWLAERGVA